MRRIYGTKKWPRLSLLAKTSDMIGSETVFRFMLAHQGQIKLDRVCSVLDLANGVYRHWRTLFLATHEARCARERKVLPRLRAQFLDRF